MTSPSSDVETSTVSIPEILILYISTLQVKSCKLQEGNRAPVTKKDVTDVTQNMDVTRNAAGMERRETSTEDAARLQSPRTWTVERR